MFKSALFFIMAFMMCLSAGARSYVRNHEDFVHLSEYQKNQHIIKVMELVVELESKYRFETKKYGYSQDRFEKFQKAISIISNVLFKNAYATGSVSSQDWNGIASTFGQILNNPQVSENNRCIFAGWISETYQSGGKTYCGHPSRSARARAGYPDPAPGCGQNNNKIQCNPVIFGYKSVSNHSLFCVSTENSAENSSLQCMKKALGLVTEEGADDSADRLRTLRDNLSNDENAFNNVQQFVYRTCVCDTTHERFNSAYQRAIRPHRTCLGLMNMIGETVNCVEPRLPLQDRSIFENLRSQITQENLSGNAADAFYRQFLSGIDRNSSEYRRVCQLQQPETPEVVNYQCESVSCPAGATQCDYVVKVQGQETAVTFSERPTEMPPAEGGSFPINFKVNNVAGTATCEAPVAPVTVEYECEATCLIAAPSTTPAANGDGTVNTNAGEVADDEPANPTAPTGDGATTTAAAQVPGCTIASLKNKATQEGVEHTVERSPALPTEAGENVNLTFGLKIGEEVKDVSCRTTTTVITTTTPGSDDDDDDNDDATEERPTLEVKIKEPKGAAAYDIEATTDKDEGWLFSWESAPPEGKTVEESWETAASENTEVAIAQDGSNQPQTTVPTSDAKTITQKRYDFNYEVCGRLTKTGKDPLQACVLVDKLGQAAADNGNRTPNVNPNLQPGGGAGGPPRGTSDTSAIGIR